LTCSDADGARTRLMVARRSRAMRNWSVWIHRDRRRADRERHRLERWGVQPREAVLWDRVSWWQPQLPARALRLSHGLPTCRRRFSPSMTSMVRADLQVCTPSHDHLRPVCLTERFISYEMRYAATPW